MSKGKAEVWMPLFIGDYLADTMHLSGPEHGAYLLLLMHSWRAGPLPDDDRALASIARTDPPAWRRMAGKVRAFFTPTDAGLVQPRLERERARAINNVEQRRTAGKSSAKKRACQREGDGRSTAVGDTLDGPCQQSSRPSPPPPPEEVQKASPSGGEAPPDDMPPDVRAELWGTGLARLRRLTGKGTAKPATCSGGSAWTRATIARWC